MGRGDRLHWPGNVVREPSAAVGHLAHADGEAISENYKFLSTVVSCGLSLGSSRLLSRSNCVNILGRPDRGAASL